MPSRPGWLPIAAIALLAMLGTALVVDHMRLDSATMDEPFHALAAAEYVLSGTAWANLEHPPLVKLLAGVPIAFAGARAPSIPRPFSFRTAEPPLHFVFSNSIGPDRLLAAARSPFPVLFFLLVTAAGLAVAWRAGAVAGVGTALVLAFEPTLVAHAGLLHTDVAAALGFFAAAVLSVAALERRSFALWAATGGALGLLLAAKFSGVFLVPVLVLGTLVFVLGDRGAPSASRYRPLAGLLLAGLVALAALLAACQLSIRNMPRAEAEEAVRLFLKSRSVPPERIETFAALSRIAPAAGHYVAGLAGVAAQNRAGGGVNVLRGRLSVEGFPEYFLVAVPVKSSLGLLALLASAASVAAVRRVRPTLFEATLAATALYLFVSGTWASYNIGVRHMLPAVPLLVAAAATLLVRTLSRRVAAALLLGCGLLQAGETWAVHPHELSFFNAAAGGPAAGERWLNDSNLDWGQDLERLARALPALGIEEKGLTVAYFGGDSPRARLPRATVFSPAGGAVGPGVVAVSSFLLAAGPELMISRGDLAAAAGYQGLREAAARGIRVGRVGYSIHLFRIGEREDSPR